MEKIFTLLKQVFTLDIRSLGLLRIGTGFLVILDLAFRLPDLRAHYANDGLLPMHLLYSHLWDDSYLSLHTINGSIYFQGFLFIVSFLSAMHLMLGFHSRTASIVSWILMVSLHNRNPLILQGGDDLLRMMLFWGMFLPWHHAFSLDQYLGRIKLRQVSRKVFSLATIGYISLVISVYFYSALLKASPEWSREFTALYYALSIDQMVFPLGKVLYRYPELMKILTMLVYYFELIIPLLLLSPVFNNTFRKIVIVSIVLFHLGISVTLYVGLFFMIGIISTLGLFPSSWMDLISERITPLLKRIAAYFDLYFKVSRTPDYPVISRNGYHGVTMTVSSFTLLFCFAWNFQTAGNEMIKCPESVAWIGKVLRIDQHWGMFAPSVFKDDGWYIYEAVTLSGDTVDLRTGGRKVTYEKPSSIVSSFSSDRWRKYSENFLFVSNNYIRPYYCDYLVREWNESNPDRKLRSLEIIYMKEVTLPDYKPSRPVKEVLAYYKL